MLERLGERGGPVVLLGDVNEAPGGPVHTALTASLLDAAPEGAATFPARDPVHRIDLVLHDPSLRVRRAEVLDGALVRRASDHLLLLVELDVHQARR